MTDPASYISYHYFNVNLNNFKNNLKSNLEECNKIIERIGDNEEFDTSIQYFKQNFKNYCTNNNKNCFDKLENNDELLRIVFGFYGQLYNADLYPYSYHILCQILDIIGNNEKKRIETFKKLYCKFVLFSKEIQKIEYKIRETFSNFKYTNQVKKLILDYALEIINTTLSGSSFGRSRRRRHRRRSRRSHKKYN
jgi:hypothetical protein